MIRASDLLSSSPSLNLPATPAVRGADAATPASWFDGNSALGHDIRISADLNPASRGLSVAEHASQVLGHLCAEPDERA